MGGERGLRDCGGVTVCSTESPVEFIISWWQVQPTEMCERY